VSVPLWTAVRSRAAAGYSSERLARLGTTIHRHDIDGGLLPIFFSRFGLRRRPLVRNATHFSSIAVCKAMLPGWTLFVATFSSLGVGPSLVVGPSLLVGASLLVGPSLLFGASLFVGPSLFVGASLLFRPALICVTPRISSLARRASLACRSCRSRRSGWSYRCGRRWVHVTPGNK
jgi:hypothetical protein